MPALLSQCLHASLSFLKQLIYFDSSDAWGHAWGILYEDEPMRGMKNFYGKDQVFVMLYYFLFGNVYCEGLCHILSTGGLSFPLRILNPAHF